MVQIKIKDNNRNREVAFIKTVPHTEKVFTDDDPKGHFQTVYYWEADPEDFFECKLPIGKFSIEVQKSEGVSGLIIYT